MKRVDEDQQETLDKVGFEIDSAIQKISTRQTEAGPIGNTLLFSSVITYYQEKLDTLDSAIQPIESSYLNEVLALRLQRAEPFNLFGGNDQPLTYITPEVTTATCGDPGEHGSFPTTSNLRSLFPNFQLYNLADYLKLGTITVCLKNELVGLRNGDGCPQAIGPSALCIVYGRNQASITLFFDGVSIMSQTITDETEQVAKLWKPDVALNWTQGKNYKAQFELRSTVDPVPSSVEVERAELAKSTTNKVHAALAGYQKELYKRILDEVSAGSLKDMALAVGGGTALLSAFTTLGLPCAIENDEFLRALLYGNQRLVDHNAIMQSYAISMSQPITGVNLLVNPRLVIWQSADQRIAAFGEIIDEYLDAITEGTHAEAADFIAGTRLALDMTMRIVHLDVPTPPVPPVTPEPSVTPETPEPPVTPVSPSAESEQIYLPSLGR